MTADAVDFTLEPEIRSTTLSYNFDFDEYSPHPRNPTRLQTPYYYENTAIPSWHTDQNQFYPLSFIDYDPTLDGWFMTERGCLTDNSDLYPTYTYATSSSNHNMMVYNNHAVISELPTFTQYPLNDSVTRCTFTALDFYDRNDFRPYTSSFYNDGNRRLPSANVDLTYVKSAILTINHTTPNFWEYPVKESINHGGLLRTQTLNPIFPIDVDPALINRPNFFNTERFTSDIVLDRQYRTTDTINDLAGIDREFLCYNLPASFDLYPQDPQVVSDLLQMAFLQNQNYNFTYQVFTPEGHGLYIPIYTGLLQSSPFRNSPLVTSEGFAPFHDCIFFSPETTLDSFISESYQLTKITQFNMDTFYATSFNNTSSLKSYIGIFNYSNTINNYDFDSARTSNNLIYHYYGVDWITIQPVNLRYDTREQLLHLYESPTRRAELCNHSDTVEIINRQYHYSCKTDLLETMSSDYFVQGMNRYRIFLPFLNDPTTIDKIASMYDTPEIFFDKLYATRYAPLNNIQYVSGLNDDNYDVLQLDLEIYLKRASSVPVTTTLYNSDSERLEFTFTSSDFDNDLIDNPSQYEVICNLLESTVYNEILPTTTNSITIDVPQDLSLQVGCSARAMNDLGWSESSNPELLPITETGDAGIPIDDTTPFRPTLTVTQTTLEQYLAISKAGTSTGAVLDDPSSRLDNNFILNSNSSHYFTTVPTHFDLRCRVETGSFMTLADNEPINLGLRYFVFNSSHFEHGKSFSCQWRDTLDNQDSVWSELVTTYIDPILPPTPNPPRLTFSITGSYNDISASLNFPENNSGDDIDIINFQCKDSGDPDTEYYNYFTNEPVRPVLRFYTEPLGSNDILECRYNVHNGVGWSEYSDTATISPSNFQTPSQPLLDLEVFLSGAIIHWSDVNTATPITSFDLQCLNDDRVDPPETLQDIVTRQPYDVQTPRSFFWSEDIGLENNVQCRIRVTNSGGFTSAWSDTTSATLVPLTITLTIKDETVGDITLINATVFSNFHPIRIADQQWFVDEELIFEDLEQRVYTRPSFDFIRPLQIFNDTQLLEISFVGDHEGQEVTVSQQKELQREYQPEYFDSPTGAYTVNYTSIRDNTDLHLKVNRGLEQFQIECNYFTETDPKGLWINHTDVYFYNESYDAGFRTIHVTCYNADELFSFISYFDGNHIQRFFSMIETEAFPSGILGVPLPVLFIIIIVAGLFSGSTSDVGSFVLLFAIGVFGFLGLIEVSPVVWAFMLLIGGISIFLGTRIRT